MNMRKALKISCVVLWYTSAHTGDVYHKTERESKTYYDDHGHHRSLQSEHSLLVLWAETVCALS